MSEIDWDIIQEEIGRALPQVVEEMDEIFSYIDWNCVPGGNDTIAQAAEAFSAHVRIEELRELIQEIAVEVLKEVVESAS